jgi:predicted ATPase/class 3 adenylate cyclase
MTFLFTDIEGSTRLWEEDPERMRPALVQHDAISRATIESNRGLVVKSTGDGVYAAFNNALDALRAAVDLQRALADPAATSGVPLRLRCGIHAGAVEQRDNDYFGSPVNRAARIMSVAHGGQVLLSQAVADSLRGIVPTAVSLRDLGNVRLNDLSTPERVYQVVHPHLRQDFPALRSLEATPNNLPQQATRFIGREQVLMELQRLFAKTRVLTLTGSGGCGKTRLCLQIAADSLEQFADGAWIVELAPLSDANRLPLTVAIALGLREDLGRAISQTLTDYLKDKRLLLFLDNCEHVLEACARLVDLLLRQCPDLTILASSREALGISGEQAYRVPSLSLPDLNQTCTQDSVTTFEAVQLFLDRAQLARPDFEVTNRNAPMLASICRRLDGIPLAIELAAARVSSLSVEEINRNLNERFRLLTGGSGAAPRQRTLRAALEWSHNLLNDGEQAVFRRSGVFAGGFTMELVQAVARDAQLDEWAVLDHVSALVDKSLVVADAGDAPRYRLLESARAFALERLAPEMAEALKRHALAMLHFLQRVDSANLDGELRTDQYAALVLPELENLRAAYAWAMGEEGDLKVAIALAAHAGSLIDYTPECANWLEPHRRRVEEGAVATIVAARYWRSLAANNMSRRVPLALSVEAAERARAMYGKLGHPRRVFSSLMRIAFYRLSQGIDEAAKAALLEARSLIRPDWPAEFRIHLLHREASLVRRAGRFVEALALEREAVRLSAATEDWRLEVIARNNLVDLLWQAGPIDDAAHEARRMVEALRTRPSSATDMDLAFGNLIGILCEMALVAEASDAAREALPIMRRSHSYVLEDWIYLFWRRGQSDVAARLLGAFDALLKRTGLPSQFNEQRLIDTARAALEKELPPDELAGHLAAGASLDSEALPRLLFDSLAQPTPSMDLRHA